MDSQELRRLKEVGEENRKLKDTYAELGLNNKVLIDILSKKFQSPASEKTWLLMRWRVIS
jgi:hypothetical protein